MADYLDEVANHVFFERSRELEDKISEAEGSLTQPLPESRFYLERLRNVNRYVRHRIESVDPVFIGKVQLDALEGYARKQVGQLQAYLTTPAVAQVPNTGEQKLEFLTRANASADQSLVQLGSIPYPQTATEVEQMRENVVSFRRSVGQHARNLQDDFKQIDNSVKTTKKEMAQVVASVDEQKRRVDKVITDYQEQFSNAEDGRREAFSSAEATRLSSFQEAESKRQERFEKEYLAKMQELDEIVKGAASQSSNMSEEFTTNAVGVIMDLERYNREAEMLVGVIGAKGIIHGYQEVANQEAATGRRWERLAVASMGLLAVFGIYAFWLAHQENFNWHFLAARAMAVIPLGVFAAYAAHKAEQHRQIERNSRTMELELAAINPYLATLPNETQYEVKRLLAERFFASDGKRIESVKVPEQTGTPTELLKPILENLKLVLETISKGK